MTLNFSINTWPSKLLAGLIALLVAGVLFALAIWHLMIGTLTDDRTHIPKEVLAVGINYFPDSPRLHARLAAAQAQGIDRDLYQAEASLRRAISLLPQEYTYRVQLGAILEAQGNGKEAELAFREALALAPKYLEVHWRLANNLVRQGKVQESLEHFRYAANRNLGLLPNAYDLIWNISNASVEAITNITSEAPKAQLALADFLVKQTKFTEAAAVYRRININARKTETESAAVLNALIAANQIGLARELWGDLMQKEESAPQPMLWNGSFEKEIDSAFAQFDWTFSDNQFVRVAIDPQTAKTGTHSLRLAFLGKDTTRLENEIRQLIQTKPGKRYRLEYQYQTRDFTTPMGPQVVITDALTQSLLIAAAPLPEGTHSWQSQSLEFTTPANTPAVFIQVQRIPKYSYDDPTRGYVWFDDFVLKELQ